jgi:hypothetical protein
MPLIQVPPSLQIACDQGVWFFDMFVCRLSFSSTGSLKPLLTCRVLAFDHQPGPGKAVGNVDRAHMAPSPQARHSLRPRVLETELGIVQFSAKYWALEEFWVAPKFMGGIPTTMGIRVRAAQGGWETNKTLRRPSVIDLRSRSRRWLVLSILPFSFDSPFGKGMCIVEP